MVSCWGINNHNFGQTISFLTGNSLLKMNRRKT